MASSAKCLPCKREGMSSTSRTLVSKKQNKQKQNTHRTKTQQRKSKKWDLELERVQWVRTLPVLSQDLTSWHPTRWFSTICNSSFGESDSLFWLP